MKTKTIFKLFAAMCCAGFFTACTNDDLPDADPMEISISKLPEFQIVSGGRMLVKSTPATRAGVEGNLLYFKKADCPDLFRENFPNQKLQKEECEHVYACIKEDAELIAAGQAPKYEVDKNSFTYKNFYIVSAYSAKDHDAKGGHSDVAGDMHDLALNGVYIKEFNTNTCVAADLIIAEDGLKQVTYDDSFGQKKQNVTVDDWKLFRIPGDEYGWYIGMDYHSAKEDLHGDGEFSDWVIKVIPAQPKVDPIDETNGEVEVNLNINDEHVMGDYVATKTSIHIRALTDVEIFIPVDKKYYCEADDMDISLSHKQMDIIYNTEPKFVQKTIGSQTVTFTVSYEDAGIRITTDGMCKDVLDFCQDQYYDGLTFEVWNYFKDIKREDLKALLDQSTITFLDNNPKTYINAFAKRVFEYNGPIYNKFNEQGQLEPYTDAECTQPLAKELWTRVTPDDKDYVFVGVKNPWDCKVAPVEPAYKATGKDEADSTLPNYNVTWTL